MIHQDGQSGLMLSALTIGHRFLQQRIFKFVMAGSEDRGVTPDNAYPILLSRRSP
jgi:hypothetical protein